MKRKRPRILFVLLNLFVILYLFTSLVKALPITTVANSNTEVTPSNTTSRPANCPRGDCCHGYTCSTYRMLKDKMKQLQQLYVQNPVTDSQAPDSLQSLTLDGDILLSPDQVDSFVLQRKIQRNEHYRVRRQMEVSDQSRWTMPIPYRIDASFNVTTAANVRRAVSLWESATCVQFREIRSDFDIPPQRQQYVILQLFGTSCASYVGYTEFLYPQPVFLSATCAMTVGSIVHELGHVIGLWHEHQRSDRDLYVKIHAENIGPGYDPWQLQPTGTTRNIEPYDYTSIMQYSAYAFSANSTSLMTIEPYDHMYVGSMGQKFGITFLGAAAVNNEYCKDTCTGTTLLKPCLNRGYQDPKACTRCRCPDGFTGDYCEFLSMSTAGCGGNLTLDPGQSTLISTPGYNSNQNYQEGTTCTWLIRTQPGIGITFDLSGFDFGMYCESKLCYHYVEVRFSVDLTVPGVRYCCTKQMDRIYIDESKQTSQTNQMMILFRSENRILPFGTQYPPWGRRGFKAKITTSAPSPAKQADIALIIESSESVGQYNWNLTKKFMKDLIQRYTVGPDDCLFALVTYSSGADIMFNFNKNSDMQQLLNAVDAQPFQAGASNTAGGLFEAGRAFDSVGSRPTAPKLVILLNDGISDIRKDELIPASQQLRLGSPDASILAIGVTKKVNMTQFISITGSADFVLTVPRFENLTDLLPSIQKMVKSTMEKGGLNGNNATMADPTLTWSCDFEDSSRPFCDMAPSSVGVFNWTRYTGKTPSDLTGPTSAASGNWYMYIEASSPRIPGDYAIIYTPIIQAAGDYCLRFYYHMYGFHIYQLRVSVGLNLVWQAQGQKGDFWLSANLDIKITGYERIQFLGMVGFGYSGDIAVDNIRLNSGKCLRTS